MGQNSVQPQSGALECPEMSLCAGGGDKRRGLQRAIKRKNMRRSGGGHFQIQQSLCREQNSRDLKLAASSSCSITATHTWSAGDYWKILWVRLLLVFLGDSNTWRCIYSAKWIKKKEPGSWNCELSFSTAGLFLTGTLIFLFLCIYSHLSSFIIWLISKCSSACATSYKSNAHFDKPNASFCCRPVDGFSPH